ncbi:MAG: DUF4160 domain-containing protein [Paludibacteraceae bacterium]|nr:DUF4160 domain-containing protein [Paludibacteraceae bacterium]
MPEVYIIYGYKIYFFANDHEPVHVHIKGNGGTARFELQGDKFELTESDNIKLGDLRRLSKSVNENKTIIVRRWNEFFKKDDDGDE